MKLNECFFLFSSVEVAVGGSCGHGVGKLCLQTPRPSQGTVEVVSPDRRPLAASGRGRQEGTQTATTDMLEPDAPTLQVFGAGLDKLAIWMKENKTKKWSMGLRCVQWQINISEHETIRQSPFVWRRAHRTFSVKTEASHLFVATMTTMTTRANLHLRPSSDAQPVEVCQLFVATMTTMTTRANLHLRPSSDAQPVEVCQLFAATMTTMTTRASLHLRPSSGAQPVEACHRFATTMTTMTTRARLHLRPSSGAPPTEACHRFATTITTMTTRARLHLRPLFAATVTTMTTRASLLSASVIGRPTRRGLPPVRYDDDDDDNASQTSSASVIGRPTRRGLSPVRYDDDNDDNASQTSSASVIGRPTRRGLSPVRGDGDDDDNASQSSSASVIGRPTRRGLSPVRYDDDDASQSSSDDRARVQRFRDVRKVAFCGQQKTAERMVEKSKRLLVNLDVGQCATIRVPDVVRGPSEGVLRSKSVKESVMVNCIKSGREVKEGQKRYVTDIRGSEEVAGNFQ
ncbi:hypothetical protein ACOMHN_007016 [Nucella lapillus]